MAVLETGKRNPRISVVVPVYNVENYLEKCLESLIGQEGLENQLEILLIDDGSEDRSGEICDAYAKQYPYIRVVHKENGGLSSARNRGIEQAGGQYVLFVDSDDYLEKDAIQILEQTLKIYGYPEIINFNGVEDDGGNLQPLREETSLDGVCTCGRDYMLSHYQIRALSVEAWLYLYKRSFLCENKLRFCEGILHEDVEFTPRAVLQARSIVEIPDRLYHYVVRENSISTRKNKEKNIRDLFSTLRKLDELAEQQDSELRRWMKDAILNSYLNMIYETRMYRKEYRQLLDKRFMLKKAATSFNQMRVCLCLSSVRLYCVSNDFYKWIRKVRNGKKCA